MNSFTSAFSTKIQDYLTFRRALGFSNDHEKHLKRFDLFCTEQFPNETILTREIVCGWFNDEIAQGRHCYENKASAIRLFAQYLGEGAYILPTEYVPKPPQFTPHILTTNELTRLFYEIDMSNNKNDPFLTDTMRVLFRLLYCCGLRPGEGRRIKISDIDFVSGEIFIQKSKRNKDRIVVASTEMNRLLKEYHLRRIAITTDHDTFFIHTSGVPLKEYEINAYMRNCWRAANPNVDRKALPQVRPYDLRHLFASTVLQNWIDDGRDLYAMLPYLRAYMGHERFEDTAYYIHLLPDRLLASPGVDWDHIDSVGLKEDIWQH